MQTVSNVIIADSKDSIQVTQILEVIKSSIRACVADHHNDEATIDEWLANKTEKNLVTWMEQTYSLVYKNKEGKIVGFFMASMPKQDNDQVEILLNYVPPEYQGQGIGKQLLLMAKTELAKKSVKSLTAESTITAKDFYQYNGFEIQKEIYEEDMNTHNHKNLVAYRMICEIVS